MEPTTTPLRTDGRTDGKTAIAEPIESWAPGAPFTVVGKPHPRVEGREKATGRATYAYDVHLPGMLYARVLRSRLPHARIRRIDTSRAEALPGVRAVISADNTPDIP